VWGSRDPATDETTCFIRFKINPEDWEKRTYHHGILQFRLDKTSGTFDEESLKDSYAGYLKSTHTEAELENIEIHSKGYAEWHSKGRLYEDAIERSLKKHGEELFAKLRRMMITRPIPRLWEGAKEKQLTQKNVWGLDIPLPQTTILDQTLRPYINQLLISVLGLVGMDEAATSRFTKSAISQAQLSADDTRVAFERELKMKLTGIARGSKLNAALYARARTIKSQIEPYLVGDSLLDIGCGNGMIASLIQSKFKQVLALDVVEYLPIELGIAFKPYREGDGLPIGDSKYDTVLLLTVLHHASAPLELLKLAWAATNKRLIIIESVVGINKLQANVKYELVNLPYDKQVAYAAFVDWFYNRVLHNDVPVPYNFTTPDQWLSTFRNHDMKVIKTEHFGQDIEIGPEYHVMFVLEKE
jgi:SAM-dependent methyltransferase